MRLHSLAPGSVVRPLGAVVMCGLLLSCGSFAGGSESAGTASPVASWSWKTGNLPNLPGGLRATSFDATRNCLWVVTRFFREAGVPLATLARFNLSDGSSEQSLVELPAPGFIRGSIAVDSAGNVWMAWGKTLARYDPASRRADSWALPSQANVVVDPVSPIFDGNAVSLVIGLDSEIWIAVSGVRTIFGFDPSNGTWNRTAAVPMSPGLFSRMIFIHGTTLVVDGVVPGQSSKLAVIDTATGNTVVSVQSVRAFAVTGTDTAVMLDDQNGIGILSLTSGQRRMLNITAPATPESNMVSDQRGNVWFSLSTIGIGKVSSGGTGYVAYPLPEILKTGGVGCGVQACQPGATVRVDPQIQSVTVDAAGNVWVMTGLPSNGGMPPLYELTGAI